jgi:hypothetical protein
MLIKKRRNDILDVLVGALREGADRGFRGVEVVVQEQGEDDGILDSRAGPHPLVALAECGGGAQKQQHGRGAQRASLPLSQYRHGGRAAARV